MNGKPLTEFRTEAELGLHIYHDDGYCALWKDFHRGDYVYSSYNDETLGTTWEEAISTMGESAHKPIWCTFSLEIASRREAGEWAFSWEEAA